MKTLNAVDAKKIFNILRFRSRRRFTQQWLDLIVLN